jgi:hypothetical protein
MKRPWKPFWKAVPPGRQYIALRSSRVRMTGAQRHAWRRIKTRRYPMVVTMGGRGYDERMMRKAMRFPRRHANRRIHDTQTFA